MKSILKFATLILFPAVILFTSCKKIDQVSSATPRPQTIRPPYALAGPDQIIVLPKDSVTLDGSGSVDPDGKIVSYLWTEISGPGQVVITNANVDVTTITGFLDGIYSFKLHVTDDEGAVDDDIVQIMFIKNLIGFEYFFQQSWSSNDGAGADNDVYVTTLSLPDLFLPNISLEVSLLLESSTVWISVPKDRSPLATNSQYYYFIGSDVLFVYASYPGSFVQLIGKGVTVKIKFL